MKENADLEQIWNEVPPNYYEVGERVNVLQRIWHREKWNRIKKLISMDAKTVLDVGSAAGHITHKIHRMLPNAKVYGLDVYDKCIEYGKKKYKDVIFVLADAHKIPFPAKTFDIVTSMESLEHVVNPKTVLKEIRRVLKDDGQLIVEMDNGRPLFHVVWFFWTKFGRGKVWKSSHLTVFNERKLEQMIESQGFIIKVKKPSHWGMGVIFEASKK